MRRSKMVRVLACALVVVTACGGDDSDGSDGDTSGVAAADPAPTASSPNATDATTDATVPSTAPASAEIAEELPEADASTFVGRNRVVHLAVLPDGSTPLLDVWARRSYEYAPILLVEGLQYGDVSDWYGRPEHMSVVAVEAGAGPDADSFAGLFSAQPDDQFTHLVMWDRERESASGFLLEEIARDDPNTFPAALPGQALVQLYAYQLRLNPLSQGDSFDQTIAGVPTAYNVGIVGIDGCAPQPRMTDEGRTPLVLGGTQGLPLDLAPGTTSFTFHGWGADDDDCRDPTKFGPLDVTVDAGQRAWVLLHSVDGDTIEALVVPLDET